jgi:hypothetical protein
MWGEGYMKEHKRGRSTVAKTLAAIIDQHDCRGIDSWGRRSRVKKWTNGYAKNKNSLISEIRKRIHAPC